MVGKVVTKSSLDKLVVQMVRPDRRDRTLVQRLVNDLIQSIQYLCRKELCSINVRNGGKTYWSCYPESCGRQ